MLLEAEVNPTEDAERIKVAFTNFFEHLRLELLTEDDRQVLRGTAEGERSLMKFQSLLYQERIIAAARKVLLRGVRGNEITFFLNRQVAFAGHISFCKPIGESPLGPIMARIFTEDPRALIDWLTPVV